MTVGVWSPAAGVPVRWKVENAADPTKSVETEATVTTAKALQTLTFNFAGPAAGTAALDLAATYNKLSLFFNSVCGQPVIRSRADSPVATIRQRFRAFRCSGPPGRAPRRV